MTIAIGIGIVGGGLFGLGRLSGRVLEIWGL